MKKKLVGVFICMLLIACVFGSAASVNNFSSIKKKNEVVVFSDSALCSGDIIHSSIFGSYLAQLDYACMCDWVNGCKDHGLQKTNFIFGSVVYFYGEVSDVQIGDIFKLEWKKGGSVYLTGESDPMDWSGSGCIWQWWVPTSVGTYQVFVYCNDQYIGSGPQFTVSYPNNPPNTPSTPSGPSSLDVDESGTFSTSATDPDGDQVQYRFDWDAEGVVDVSDWTSLGASGHTGSLSNSWNASGTYAVKAQAKDDNGAQSGWSSGLTVVISEVNQPPNKPTLSGETNGKVGQSYIYSASTIDPDDDKVEYWYDWDDGQTSGWLGLYNSGEICEKSHIWDAEGSYSLKVKARDIYGAESEWSDPLSVTMPRNRLINNPMFTMLIEGFVERFPLIARLLKLL